MELDIFIDVSLISTDQLSFVQNKSRVSCIFFKTIPSMRKYFDRQYGKVVRYKMVETGVNLLIVSFLFNLYST